MGKIVAVHSDMKNTGKSVTAFMVANQLKAMGGKDMKILVCCLNFRRSLLYKLFQVQTSNLGLEELANLKIGKNEMTEALESVIPKSDGIYFLGTYRMTEAFAHKNTSCFKSLLEELKNEFDILLFDTVSERDSELTGIVLEKADIILELFVQDDESLSGLNAVCEQPVSYGQQVLYLVSKYRNIYPKYTDIKRRFALEKMYTMAYCETLQEMKNRNHLHLYIQRETDCNKSVSHISGHILETLGLGRTAGNRIRERGWKYFISSLYGILN